MSEITLVLQNFEGMVTQNTNSLPNNVHLTEQMLFVFIVDRFIGLKDQTEQFLNQIVQDVGIFKLQQKV